jgi:hypothetical protein
MRRHAPSKWPTRLGAIVGITLAFLGWLYVRRDIRRTLNIGFTPGAEWGFIAFLLVAGAVATWFITRRILDGPNLQRSGWSLSFTGPILAKVNDLIHQLGQRGYRLEVSELDDATEPVRVAPPDRALGGSQLGLAATDSRTRARVTLRLSQPDAPGAPGLGLVESEDTTAGFYDELAEYLVATLGELVPSLAYKRADSALDPESAASLRSLLPEKPSRLDRAD